MENEAPAPGMDGEEEEHSLLYETFAWFPGLIEFFIDAWKDPPGKDLSKANKKAMKKYNQPDISKLQGAQERGVRSERPRPVGKVPFGFEIEHETPERTFEMPEAQVVRTSALSLAAIPYEGQVLPPIVAKEVEQQNSEASKGLNVPEPIIPKNPVIAEQTLGQFVQAPIVTAPQASFVLGQNMSVVTGAPITPNQIVGKDTPTLSENLYYQMHARENA